MTKFAVAALAFALASSSILPALAQSTDNPNCRIRCEEPTPAENCGDQLGHLKRVFPAEVQGVDSHYRVWVTEFCLSSDLLRSEGNADYLRTAIADNDVLVDMLAQKGYRAEDVYAVKMMGDDTINLFVHDFGR